MKDTNNIVTPLTEDQIECLNHRYYTQGIAYMGDMILDILTSDIGEVNNVTIKVRKYFNATLKRLQKKEDYLEKDCNLNKKLLLRSNEYEDHIKKSQKYQINYEDALRICKAYNNNNFYKTEYFIDGYKIVTFNYFLCNYNNFVKPLPSSPEINAYDMRGVTFVFNTDGTLFKRYLMLRKFFNLNQVSETQLHLLKDKKIKNATIKEDGSLIAFMRLPNGKVFSKTMGGFDNSQAENAINIYENDEDLKNYVNEMLDYNYTPLFEYLSYDNRVVVNYKHKELRLIGIRNNDTGEYTSASYIKDLNIPHVSSLVMNNLSEYIEFIKNTKEIEGVVIEFVDGQMIKIKTQWYLNLHSVRTESIFREDYIIKEYLSGKLDDILQDFTMDKDDDIFKFTNNVINAVIKWSEYIDTNVNELVDKWNNKNENCGWNSFAIDNHKNPFFSLVKTKIENFDMYKEYKIQYMLKSTKRLKLAKNIVDKWSN